MEEGYGGSDRGYFDVPPIRRGVRPDTVKVVKFNGKFFILWKQSLEVYLKIANLFEFVTGTAGKPSEGTLARREWEQMNNQAMGVLIGALTEEQHWLVTQCTTGAEMWTTLQRTYMRSAANKGQLIEEYESYSMGRCVSLDTNIRELKNKQEKLRGVGIVSDEEMKVLKLLRGLSEVYDMDRKIIQNTPEISFEEACSKLLNEADINRKRVETKAPMANVAEGRARPVRRCFNCN
jgi:gag-polypeptide of LTR copia-type